MYWATQIFDPSDINNICEYKINPYTIKSNIIICLPYVFRYIIKSPIDILIEDPLVTSLNVIIPILGRFILSGANFKFELFRRIRVLSFRVKESTEIQNVLNIESYYVSFILQKPYWSIYIWRNRLQVIDKITIIIII